MTQPAQNVNDAEAFLSRFSGKIFIRLIHGAYDDSTKEPKRLKPRQFYGTAAECVDWLNRIATVMNSGVGDDYKFNVFYVANDPMQGKHAQQGDIAALRVIYQDCDDKEAALNEPELDGVKAHAVVESSPGKRQRIWHIEPIDPFRQRAIHDHMCTRHFHDPSTHGPHRLLRLPGFRNWKYDDGPLAKLIGTSETPRMTEEQVFKAFGMRTVEQDRGNIEAAAHRIQNSGDLPEHKVYSLDRERAKRSGQKSASTDEEARMRDAEDIAPGELPVHVLLDALSLIEPDTHRNEWRRVLAALHYMANGREWGEVIAEAWSSMGLEKFNVKSFKQHWNGLDREVSNPATWLTIKRITANKKHNEQTRALRHCELFKRFEADYGPVLEYEQLFIEYRRFVKADDGDGTVYRPDPRARENIEYLLNLEAIEVYYDEFQQLALAKVDGNVQEIDQRLIMELYSTAHVTGLRVDDAFLAKQIEAIALDTKRDPVREYLSRLPMWDGTPRLQTAFIRLMGAPDTPSVREVLPLLMMAMIRRTFRPGYKFDLMAILEGRQGLGKSSFFRLLMPFEEWFSEGPKLNEEAKRLLSQLGGKLVIEFGELVGMSKQSIDGIKKLITQQVDEYTANYARKKTRSPRRCVFVGTVNGTQYLRDLTDNRRFPIIPVTTELDYAKLKAEREQLWAEAMLEETLAGDLRLSEEGEADMREMQELRLDVNSETTAFMNEIAHVKHAWMTTETIWDRLGYPFHERHRRTGHAQFLFKEVKDLMERDGWSWNKPTGINGRIVRVVIKRAGRGQPPEILCNGGTLTSEDQIPDIEELLK